MSSLWTFRFVFLAVFLSALAAVTIVWRHKEAIAQHLPSPSAAQLKHWFLLSYGICLPIAIILDWRTGACFLCVALVKMATVPADAFLGTHSRTRTPFANLSPWTWRLIAWPYLLMLIYCAVNGMRISGGYHHVRIFAATTDAVAFALKALCVRGMISMLAGSWSFLAKWKASGELDRIFFIQIPLMVLITQTFKYFVGIPNIFPLLTLFLNMFLDQVVSGNDFVQMIGISSLSITVVESVCLLPLALLLRLDLLRSLGLMSSMLAGVMLCPSRDQLRCWQWKARSWFHQNNQGLAHLVEAM